MGALAIADADPIHSGREPAPGNASLLGLLRHGAPDKHFRRRILAHNPAALYGFDNSAKGKT